MDNIEVLENSEELKKIDNSGMLALAESMPELLAEALALAKKVPPLKVKNIRQIVFSGMGGSAIAGDIAGNLLLAGANVPSFVNRNFKAPAYVDKNTLFFALSYSGNTDETLSALKDAERAQAEIVCVTSGGKLAEIAGSHNYPLYLIPSGYQPRAALPFILVAILKCLEGLGSLPDVEKDILRSVEIISRLKDEYGMEKPLRANPVKQLARKIAGKIPVIFGSEGRTDAAALRIKNQLNENSKLTAFCNSFPELDHNEIVNLSALKRDEHSFVLVFLRDDGDLERIQKGIEITKSLIGRQLGGVHEIFAQGKSLLCRILSLIYFGDLLSVYLAVLSGTDPTPVDVITRLKKELGR